MKPTNLIEDRLNDLGKQLRSRPTLIDNVKHQLEKECSPIRQVPVQLTHRELRASGHRRQYLRLAFASSLVAAVTLLLATLFLTSSASIGWAQVVEAVRQQKWLHGETTFQDGKRGQMWLSLSENLWAYELGDSRYFYDGKRGTKFQLSDRQDALLVLALSEDEQSHPLPVASLTEEAPTISRLFSTEKVVHQQQRTVEDKGRQWIEFALELSRGEFSLATLRVDPETRLPVRVTLTSINDSTKSIVWNFDYPPSGPNDIFEMGVNRDLPLVDLRPDATAQRVIDGVAASRRRIEDFQMLVSTTPGFVGYAVWRNGERWRVDLCYLMRLGGKPWPTTPLDENENGRKWFDEQIGITERVPLTICDGRSVWHNKSTQPGTQAVWEQSSHIAPTDLMSGEGLGNMAGAVGIKFPSLLYPDLSRKPGWDFSFEAAPASNPDLVLIKRSSRLATTKPNVGHEWYYIDPARGYAVVKAELFTVSADQPADPDSTKLRQTIVMGGLHASPNGNWYAKSIDISTPIRAPGQDLNVSGHHQTVTHYDLIPNPEFPEDLFVAPQN